MVQLIFVVKHLFDGSGPVPEGDLTIGSETFKLIEDMGAHGRHTRTTTNEHHFIVSLASKEFTERTRDGHFVAWLQVEYVGRHDTRRYSLRTRRRRGNTHIQHDYVAFFGIVRH